MASVGTPPTVDLDDTGGKPQGWEIANNLYDKQIFYPIAADGKTRDLSHYVPRLWASWQHNPNGSVWTVDLRKGVKSCHGNELTSADVVWSWHRAFVTNKLGAFLGHFAGLSSGDQVKAVGKYSVRFNLSGPSPLFLPVAALGRNPIYDSVEAKKHVSASDPWGATWLATHDAGFGAYCIDSFVPGQQIILKANPNYYGGKLKIQHVVYKAVSDASTRLALLANGDADIALSFSPDQLASLKNNKRVAITNALGTAVYSMITNNNVAPFNNLLVRKALLYATPYDQILNDVYKGSAQRTKAFVSPQWPGYTAATWPYETNVAKAKQLLAQSGVTLPINFTLTYAQFRPTDDQVAIDLKDAYAKVGVNITLRIITPAQNGAALASRNYDAILYRMQPQAIDPVYGSEVYTGQGALAATNWANYHNRRVFILYDQMHNVIGDAARVAAEKSALRLLAETPPYVPIATQNYVVAHAASVSGIVWQPDEGLLFNEIVKK